MRDSLVALDEAIENAKTMGNESKNLQWSKQLLNLIQLRDVMLTEIKGHLLGRDETGAVTEPPGVWEGSPQVEYERFFNSQLREWSFEDLKLTCELCGKSSTEVRTFHSPAVVNANFEELKAAEDHHFCPECSEKRASRKVIEK